MIVFLLSEYDSLSRLGIPDCKNYIKKRFKDDQLVYLSTCCCGRAIQDQIESSVDEALSSGTWVDVMVRWGLALGHGSMLWWDGGRALGHGSTLWWDGGRALGHGSTLWWDGVRALGHGSTLWWDGVRALGHGSTLWWDGGRALGHGSTLWWDGGASSGTWVDVMVRWGGELWDMGRRYGEMGSEM